MNIRRRWVKVLMRFFLVILIITVVAIGSDIIYENFLKPDDSAIQERYNVQKEKFDLLKRIAQDCIEEGKGIDTQKILYKDIYFNLYNKGENIIFHYYIDEENSDRDSIKATITLSKDYKILDEEYAEISSYKKYKRGQQFVQRYLSVLFALLVCLAVCIIGLIIGRIYWAVKWLIKFFKRKKSQKTKFDS